MDLESRLERLDAAMAGTLMHPGDEHTEPFPVMPVGLFQNQAIMPPGFAEDMAEKAGLPHPNFARIYREVWLHTLATVCEVTLVPNDELADLRAAAAAQEYRRNQALDFQTTCGQTVRAMVRGFDTQHPQVPCEMVRHECRGRR